MVSHWLMKTEPESFGIDDLERVKIEAWTGVRNYMARNLMRDGMQVGDPVLFYHSSCEPPGVAGLARVVRTQVVDATQFDPTSKYYDPDSKPDAPRWICVDVELVRRLPRFVALDELRGQPGLDGMLLLQRGSRLSVQPVSAGHYALIVDLANGPAPEPEAKQPRSPKPKTTPTPTPTLSPKASPKPKPKPKPSPKPKPTSKSSAKSTSSAKPKPSPKPSPRPSPTSKPKPSAKPKRR